MKLLLKIDWHYNIRLSCSWDYTARPRAGIGDDGQEGESRDLEVDHRDEPVHLIITCRRDQPQIQEGAQACHVNRRSQASVEEEVMKDRPAVSLASYLYPAVPPHSHLPRSSP